MTTLDFEKLNGLIPAIMQDASTNRVLMLGFMNREALEKTKKQALLHFTVAHDVKFGPKAKHQEITSR